MKKIVLTMVMLLATIIMLQGCGAKASEGLEYKSNGDGTCALVGIGTCEDEEVVVPKKSPDGDNVTSIADNAFKNSNISSITMADEIIEIGVEAFSGCSRLEDVKFSKSLKKIGSKAFLNCENIAEIVLPDSLEEFGKSIGSDGEEYEGSGTFMGCEKLVKINIPKKVKAIYEDTFKNTALTEVELDAEFRYGHASLQFWNDEENPLVWYIPTLYLEKTEIENDDIIELTDSIKMLLYAEVFYNKEITINGEQITIPTAQCTAGFYGAEDNNSAYNITSENNIELMWFNKTSGEYEIDTTYPENEEKVYDFEFNDKTQAFEYVDEDGEIEKFLVYDNYLFSTYAGRLELDVKCKE